MAKEKIETIDEALARVRDEYDEESVRNLLSQTIQAKNFTPYSLDRIHAEAPDAPYYIIIGGRSTGKTTTLLVESLVDYMKTAKRMVVIRRLDEQIKGKRGTSIFNGIEKFEPINGISIITGGVADRVVARGRDLHLARLREDGTVEASIEPFCLLFAVNQMENTKGSSYPNISRIIFDEFISRGSYLPDEVSKFINLISTLVRNNDGIPVYMLGNTVAWNAPYLESLGIRDIKTMRPGTVKHIKKIVRDPDTGGDKEVRIGIEMTISPKKGKSSDVYAMVYDSKTAKMVTDGEFETPEYPKCPHKFGKDNVLITYWVVHEDTTLRLRLIAVDSGWFVFVESVPRELYKQIKTDYDFVYSLGFSESYFHLVNPLRASTSEGGYVSRAVSEHKMFFSSVMAGEDFVYYCNLAANASLLSLE